MCLVILVLIYLFAEVLFYFIYGVLVRIIVFGADIAGLHCKRSYNKMCIMQLLLLLILTVMWSSLQNLTFIKSNLNFTLILKTEFPNT